LATPAIFHKAQALRPGDSVAVIAPAGPFDRGSFESGVAVIAERYRVQYDPGIFQQKRYLAGDDHRRLEELTHALADHSIRGIFCARGGYGTMRLLQKLQPQRAVDQPGRAAAARPDITVDSTQARGRTASPTTGATPSQSGVTADGVPVKPGVTALPIAKAGIAKPLVGFSDITALHQWRQSQGIASIHGPVLTQLGRLGRATSERLFSLLESNTPAKPLYGSTSFVDGFAEGPLLGGNLSVFTRLLGTPFMPALDGAVLLLEDVGERPYCLDRMWTQLDLAGVFRKISGIALGSFTHCEERDAAYSSQDVLRELAVATGLPCATGFPIGHGDINEPVPLGVRVCLDATAAQLTFKEPAVSEQ
jgi:muramoyltetrapeptide carboxypeptidase